MRIVELPSEHSMTSKPTLRRVYKIKEPGKTVGASVAGLYVVTQCHIRSYVVHAHHTAAGEGNLKLVLITVMTNT